MITLFPHNLTHSVCALDWQLAASLCLTPHSLFTLPPNFNPAYSKCAWRVNELTCVFIKFEQPLLRLFPKIDFR